jgi:hypothetical protein
MRGVLEGTVEASGARGHQQRLVWIRRI